MPNIHVRELRSLAGRMDGTVRRATLNGREHIVVPIVAMIGDAVIRPMNSRGPEYIPADVLSSICSSWNGRDVVMAPDVGHPTLNGSPISANSPDVADRHCYGRVYNARYEDNRFRAEMWLDPIRAAAVGPHAVDVIDRALAGLPVEVSIGATAYELAQPGTSPSGVAYDYRWVHAESDHLATLPRGLAGACSVEMGCGGPRYASQETLMASIEFPVPAQVAAAAKMTLRKRLRRALNDILLLHDQISGDTDNGDGEDAGESETAVVTPVAATSTPNSVDNPADNHVTSPISVEADNGGTARQKENCMCQSAKDLAGRLIAKGEPFSEDQRPTLEALGEATLRALVEQNPNPSPKTPDQPTVPTPENPPTPSPGPKSVAATLASLTEADILSHFPSLASAVNENNARNAEIRASLVAALRDNTNGAYTPEELAALPIPALRQLTKALSLDQPKIDYGVVGLASSPYTSTTAERDIPDAWGIDKVKPS